MRGRFPLEFPVDLRETLEAGHVGPGDPCLKLSHAEAWRATRTPLGPATEHLKIDPDGALSVEAWGAGAEWLVERAPLAVGARDNPSGFAPAHPLLQALTRRHRGLRIGRTEAVFESTLAAVIQQRVAFRDAWRSWRALVRSLGEHAPGPVPDLWVPPAPDRVARTPYEVFHRFGIERRRGDILRRVAYLAPRLEEASTLGPDQARRRLMAATGIGPWTSARVAVIALGDPDAVCVGDLHLPHLVTWALAGERNGSDERMLELLEPYVGHRARVQRLLFTESIRGGLSLAWGKR